MSPTSGVYIATAAERQCMFGDYIVAGQPEGPTSGWGIQHLFERPGLGSLCDEVGWLRVVRWEQAAHGDIPARIITPATWICVRCQAAAVARAVQAGACPACRGPLTDPQLSPGGWAHCRRCRRGWLAAAPGVVGCDWPGRAEGAA